MHLGACKLTWPHPQLLCCCMHILLHGLRCLGLIYLKTIASDTEISRLATPSMDQSKNQSKCQFIIQSTSPVQSPESTFYNNLFRQAGKLSCKLPILFWSNVLKPRYITYRRIGLSGAHHYLAHTAF